MRRHALTIAVVVGCLAAGVASFALAADARAVQAAFVDDDIRFGAAPEGRLWAPRELLPGAIARRLLGAGDDLLLRNAVRSVRLSHPETPGLTDPAYVVHRSDATSWLTDVVQHGSDPARRSAAANLLGVLSFADAIADYTDRNRLLEASAGRFRQAIALDSGNEDAKYNLELTLAQSRGLELSESAGGANPSPGGSGARGAGAGDAGSGY